MNLYIVTEGMVEKKVYKRWIPYLNTNLHPVEDIRNVENNHFYIVHANGQPNFLDVCIKGIEDVNNKRNFDRLILVGDSESKTSEEKHEEILKAITPFFPCKAKVNIVIQHFCIETWALGNVQIIRKKPTNTILKSYLRMHDVRVEDPEELPENLDEALNRAQFAEKYLRTAILDKFPGKSYHKSRPNILYEQGYFYQIKKRFEDKKHIRSFQNFLEAFS